MTLKEANAFVEQHHRHHKPVPREEKPTLYKAMEGIPGAEDATLMRGTLRVLRKERW